MVRTIFVKRTSFSDNAKDDKSSEPAPQTASSTQRSRPSNSRRADFQEVQVRPSGQDPAATKATLSTGNMSARHDSSRESGGSSHRNRYARHAADPSSGGNNSLQHGQSAAATSRAGRSKGGSTRPDLQEGPGKKSRHDKEQKKANAAPMLMSGDDDVVFETFVHSNGREFVCAVRGGRRYYLDDWHSHEWQPFPERWYSEGRLVPMDDNSQTRSSSHSHQNGTGESHRHSERDDREGYLKHPKRGRVETYLMEERHYVHFFFDRQTGKWLRLPIGWELHHSLVKQMVDHVEEALPHWGDRADILALLRACNYNPDECIGTYLLLDGDALLNAWKSAFVIAFVSLNSSLKPMLTALSHGSIHPQQTELETERKSRKEAERQLSELEEKYSKISAEATSAQHQMEAMQQSRPKTAHSRPKTPVAVAVPEGPTQQDLEQLNRKVKSLRKSHVHLKMDMLRNIGSVGAVIKEKEALQRRLLYNQLQELRGNIRVFCRPRRDDRAQMCLKFPSDQDVMVSTGDGSKKMFNFDKVYNTEATQEQIFTDTQPIITSCVDGYNVCLLAYGQTGSGKTFTMMGPDNNPGINIRAITELLKVCAERTETKTYTLKVSMVEIYNETVQDLLTSDARTLELQMVGNVVRIPNITEMEVSRSHLVLMINVSGEDKVTGAISKGVLTLCDLAGSERISKTEATGQRLVEAAAINKSLSALGQVFSALRESQLHVPYRNSKLTQILRPCLGGDAKACLFVNISPDVTNYPETCNTLEFGSNARQVALGQAKQNIQKRPGGFPPR
ncbi:kinesin-like protein [Elysia marginata]|uniref:Kinesin-like protein n=1 Tax=Elysia marginata TaxID=1093978 RepID=A0AAV4HZ91_9GAST|nr:kinesin-like protein [Elysia marginata]